MEPQNFFKPLFKRSGRTALKSAMLASLALVILLAACSPKSSTPGPPDPGGEPKLNFFTPSLYVGGELRQIPARREFRGGSEA